MVRRLSLKLFNSQGLILSLSLILLGIFCVYPFSKLILRVLTPEQSLDFRYVLEVLQYPGAIKAMKNTLLVALSVAGMSFCFGVPVGWLLTRTDIRGRGLFRTLFCLPYAVPPYIGAMAWIYLANPSTGILNLWFGEGFLNVYSFMGLVWVESCFLFTFVLLATLTSLERMDPSLEEAARLSGASPFQVFFRITLPVIRPSLIGAVILVILASVASFGVPALIGGPAKIFVMTTQIYTYQKMGSMAGLFKAGALSIVLLLPSLALLFFNQWLITRQQFQMVSGKSSRHSLLPLRSYQWPTVFLLVVAISLFFLIPILGILFTALNQVPGTFELENLSFDHLSRIFFETDETFRAFANSLILAAGSATVAVALAVFLAYFQLKTKMPGRRFIGVLASFPYSTPGTIVALALILAFSQGVFGYGPNLYNTLWLIGLAYVVKFLSLSIKTIGDGYGQIDETLAEASRVSGASWLQTVQHIWLPLLTPVLVAAWFLIFMPAFTELTMTILLSGPGLETLGTLIFQLQEYADPSGGSSAVLALLVIAFVVLVNTFIKWFSKGRFGL